MAITVRIPATLFRLADSEQSIEPAPANLGALIELLEDRFPGVAATLNSSAVNAAVNGEVVLHDRDAIPLNDGDDVEFLMMFGGG